MTRQELIKLNKTLLDVMANNGITTKDVKYIPMMETYTQMKLKGYKRAYIVRVLCEQYVLSERAFYKIVNRMDEDVVL